MTEQPEPEDTCRPVDIDGDIIRVHGAEELSEQGQAALTEVVRAARRRMINEQRAAMAATDPELRRQLTAAIDALGKAETELAALRQVARGYCPACGRGDAAPTVQHWEHQRQRADAAERERDTARQHTAAIAAQRDRLRQRMNTLADRWETALPVDKPYARTLRAEISVDPFDPNGAMTVKEYTERGRTLWAFRCWGTDTCDGWLGLGHETQTSALLERERHAAEAHTIAVHRYLSTGCLHDQHDYCSNVDGIAGLKKPAQCKFCAAPCVCPCHTEQPNT